MSYFKKLIQFRNYPFLLFVLFLLLLNSESKADKETLYVSPQEINFGTVTVGIEKKTKILITNMKNEPVEIQEIRVSNANNFWIDDNKGDNPCGNNKILSFKEKCSIEVYFLPFEDKKYKSELKIYTSDGKKTKIKSYGRGVQTENPEIQLTFTNGDKNSYDYGYVFVGDSASEMFTIRNNGKGLLVFNREIRVSDDEHFEVDVNGGTNPCGSKLPILNPKESCTFKVYFKPEKEKTYKTELKLNSNDKENEEIKIKLYGKGTLVPVPKIELIKARENFVDTQVGKTSNLMVQINNKGNGVLEVVNMYLSNEDNFWIDVNSGTRPCKTLSPSIDPGEFCTIYIKFKPEKNKTYKTSLYIESNDTKHKKVKISVKGKGKNNISEASTSETFSNSSSGCNFGTPSVPVYLLLLLIFGIRTFLKRTK